MPKLVYSSLILVSISLLAVPAWAKPKSRGHQGYRQEQNYSTNPAYTHPYNVVPNYPYQNGVIPNYPYNQLPQVNNGTGNYVIDSDSRSNQGGQLRGIDRARYVQQLNSAKKNGNFNHSYSGSQRTQGKKPNRQNHQNHQERNQYQQPNSQENEGSGNND